MNRPLRTLLAASGMLLAAAPGATAQAKQELDVLIEPDTRPRAPMVSGLSVVYNVTVRDRATGAPEDRYVVFAQATNRQGEKSVSFACGHTNDVDPRTPPGVYYCTVILDHGGAWEFVAVVSEKVGEEQAPVPVAQASVPFELATDKFVTSEVPGAEISASVGDVAVLFGHTAVAVAWFACVAMLVALALPGARRYLSTVGCHRLERRLDLILKATWITIGLVLGSGTYLTFTQTAYDAPFSSSAVDAVFKLPYGKPYFLALATKIGLYLLMVVATLPLVRGAKRRLLAGDDVPAPVGPVPVGPVPVDDLPAGVAAGGGVACDVRTAPPPVALQPAPGRGRLGVAVAVVVGGGVGIALCVTVLKYLHELIETARGLL